MSFALSGLIHELILETTMSVTNSFTTAVMLITFCLALIASASCLERDPRIIGGTPTTINKHPYQVSSLKYLFVIVVRSKYSTVIILHNYLIT